MATCQIVGWSMANHLRADLCIDALVMALQRCQPARSLIHHSDRGVQGGFKWSSQHRALSAFRYRSSGHSTSYFRWQPLPKVCASVSQFSTMLMAPTSTSVAPCLVSSRTSRRCAPVPQAASWTRPAHGALPEAGRLRGMVLSISPRNAFASGTRTSDIRGPITSRPWPIRISSGRRSTWPIRTIAQAPRPEFSKPASFEAWH
jgi:hypothetical protein